MKFRRQIVREYISIMADINDEAFQKSQCEFQDETHTQHGCQYQSFYMNKRIRGTNIRIKVLIRICKCGKQTNREAFLDRKNIELWEVGDGVEFHLDNRCKYYEPKGSAGSVREFLKECYCKPQQAMLR